MRPRKRRVNSFLDNLPAEERAKIEARFTNASIRFICDLFDIPSNLIPLALPVIDAASRMDASNRACAEARELERLYNAGPIDAEFLEDSEPAGDIPMER